MTNQSGSIAAKLHTGRTGGVTGATIQLPQYLTLDELDRFETRFSILLRSGRLTHIDQMLREIERLMDDRRKPRTNDPRQVQVGELLNEDGDIRIANSLDEIGVYRCDQALNSSEGELRDIPGFGDWALGRLRELLRERFGARVKGRIFEGMQGGE